MLSKEEYYFPIHLLLNILAMLLLMQSSMSLSRHAAGLLSTGNHRSFSPEQVPSLVPLHWTSLSQILDFALVLLDFHDVLVDPFLYLLRSFQKNSHTLNHTDSTPSSVSTACLVRMHTVSFSQHPTCLLFPNQHFVTISFQLRGYNDKAAPQTGAQFLLPRPI